MEPTSKARILKKIRSALVNTVPQPYPELEGNTKDCYYYPHHDLPILFAEQFTALGGKFTFCQNKSDLYHQLKSLIQMQNWTEVICWEEPLLNDLIFNSIPAITHKKEMEQAQAAITYCEKLIARTGTILLSSKQEAGRTLGAFAPVHIVIATISQIIQDIKDATLFIKTNYGLKLPSMLCFTTGPSRTADIEKTLVVGVHGPKEIYVFLLE